MQASVTNSVVHPNAFQHVKGPLVLGRMKGWVVAGGDAFMLSAQWFPRCLWVGAALVTLQTEYVMKSLQQPRWCFEVDL